MTRHRPETVARLISTLAYVRKFECLSTREYLDAGIVLNDLFILKSKKLLRQRMNPEMSEIDGVHHQTKYWYALPLGGPYKEFPRE